MDSAMEKATATSAPIRDGVAFVGSLDGLCYPMFLGVLGALGAPLAKHVTGQSRSDIMTIGH